MENKAEQTTEMKELMFELEYKDKMLKKMKNDLCNCHTELYKNKEFICICQNMHEIDAKKQDKFVKNLEKTENELEELRNLIIKQNELKKVTPTEFEEVFEQTKIQLEIRKNDLKKKIKDLKIKITFCKNENNRNIENLTTLNECLEKKIMYLEADIKETISKICKIQKELGQEFKENV